jgi:uncharacterized Fe-S cluster-containing radical SAM superfamily protein
VVLVNFRTLTCINWLRQEPYVREGRYEESERVIQRLLGIERELVSVGGRRRGRGGLGAPAHA